MDDLRAVTKGELLSHALDRGEMRLNGLDHRITTLHRQSDATSFRPDPGVSPGELTEVMGHAFGLGLTIKKARLDDFPVVVLGGTMTPTVAKSVQEVVDQLEPVLIGLEQRVKRLETKSRQGRALETRLVDRVAAAVKGFLLAGEAAVLSGKTGQSREKLLREAHVAMRRLGHAAEVARPRLGATSGSALGRLMRALIDGPYLMLSEPGVEATGWAHGQRRVEQVLGDLLNTTSHAPALTKP